MNQTFISGIILLIMLSACSGNRQLKHSISEKSAGDEQNIPQPASASGKQWVLQSEYSDEFNETKLDLKKWDNDVYDWGVWSWEPENTWVGEGHLHLRIQYNEHQRNEKTLFYKSGIIKSANSMKQTKCERRF